MTPENENNMQELLYVGIDLGNESAQISYYSNTLKEPKSISATVGEEKFQIPVVLFKKTEGEKWFFGEEAYRMSWKTDGVLIPEVLELCKKQDTITIQAQEVETVTLLGIFLQRLLNLLSYNGQKTQHFHTITVSVEKTDKSLSEKIKKAIWNLPISCMEVCVQDYTESFFYFTSSLPEDLYRFDVMLFQCKSKDLLSYHMKSNTHTSPNLVTITENPIGDFLTASEEREENPLDTMFLKHCKMLFEDNRISSVFLVGEEFERNWMKKSIRFLCSRTRVFQGRNLYCKGACYSSYYKSKLEEESKRVYLNKNKTKYNFGIYTLEHGKPVYHTLLSAGGNWYETKGEWEFYLEEADRLEILIQSFDNQDNRTIVIPFSNLLNRPKKTIRLKLTISFDDENTAVAIVNDCGFGEYYQASSKVWKHEIRL